LITVNKVCSSCNISIIDGRYERIQAAAHIPTVLHCYRNTNSNTTLPVTKNNQNNRKKFFFTAVGEDRHGVWQRVAMDSLKFHPTRHALPFYALRMGNP
jgi:hypothetical protein